jgi:hypothetical protein
MNKVLILLLLASLMLSIHFVEANQTAHSGTLVSSRSRHKPDYFGRSLSTLIAEVHGEIGHSVNQPGIQTCSDAVTFPLAPPDADVGELHAFGRTEGIAPLEHACLQGRYWLARASGTVRLPDSADVILALPANPSASVRILNCAVGHNIAIIEIPAISLTQEVLEAVVKIRAVKIVPINVEDTCKLQLDRVDPR